MDLVRRLFADYNHYRRHCRNMLAVRTRTGFMPPDLVPSDERLRAVEAMARWCLDRRYDPPLWLYTLFTARHWMYPPRFEHLTAASHEKRYRKAQRLGFYERRQRSTRLSTRRLHDPNRDTTPSVEAVKRAYRDTGAWARCMDQTASETLGYHPGSDVCRACPMARPCADKLTASVPFDIAALRRGEIDAATAERQAHAYWRTQTAPRPGPRGDDVRGC